MISRELRVLGFYFKRVHSSWSSWETTDSSTRSAKSSLDFLDVIRFVQDAKSSSRCRFPRRQQLNIYCRTQVSIPAVLTVSKVESIAYIDMFMYFVFVYCNVVASNLKHFYGCFIHKQVEKAVTNLLQGEGASAPSYCSLMRSLFMQFISFLSWLIVELAQLVELIHLVIKASAILCVLLLSQQNLLAKLCCGLQFIHVNNSHTE